MARQEAVLAAHQEQIAQLRAALEEQKQRLDRSEQSSRAAGSQAAGNNQLASLQPVIPAGSFALASEANTVASALLAGSSSAGSATAGQEQPETYTRRVDQLSKDVEGITKGLAGFKFSGDLRLRSDNLFRSANSLAGAEQNVRLTYRARLNLDKGITDQLDAHFQLGSGKFNNPTTDDSEFGGGAVPGPLTLREAWVSYHPNTSLSLKGGKMYEVFQDGSRFMWDEDVRFNGFQESVGRSPEDNPLGITRIDFRAGEYVLTNPNIQVLPTLKQCTSAPPQTITSLPATIITPVTIPAACAYLSAGYLPGQNVRSADLFDQGVFVKGRINEGWSHYLYTNFLLYRNANQIALGSTTLGAPLLTNNEGGVTLVAPLPGTGNATTTPGGGIYTAGRFQIGHLAYRLTYNGWKLRSEEFPIYLDIQGSRNFGAGFLRNAWMATLNAGDIKKTGDVRFVYAYGEKDANSMISQFTDDHFGTNTGVNIRTHEFRVDVGLGRFMEWQNIFYIQNEISPNDPARHFYVPVPEGTPTSYRAESAVFVHF
jgi:hypothetical protein